MSVGVLLVTHGRIGQSILDTANVLLPATDINIRNVSVPIDCDTHSVEEQIKALLNTLDTGNGVLVLTDIFGATPCNLIMKHGDQHALRVLAGLSLPMLIRVINYHSGTELETLAEKAFDGGRTGIMYCTTGDNN